VRHLQSLTVPFARVAMILATATLIIDEAAEIGDRLMEFCKSSLRDEFERESGAALESDSIPS